MLEITTKSANHLYIECSSEFEHLDAIVDGTEEFLKPLVTDEELSYQIVLLLSEAVTNAIEHGNAHDVSKHLKIELNVRKENVIIQVEDEGEGFDPNAVSNPLEDENLLNDSGRGIFFIEQIADKVWYENEGRRVYIQFDRVG